MRPLSRPVPRPLFRRLSLFLSLLLLFLVACSSPNRGVWRGTFDGSIAGTVEFRINSRGTKLTGSLSGTTRDGAPFEADMEGKIRDEYFYATFEGRGRAGVLPVAFEGFLRGELRQGQASGDWECTLRVSGREFSGDWRADQVTLE